MTKLIIFACIALTAFTVHAQLLDDGTHQLLDIQTPQTFNINSPLKQPDSLRSRPYFDFLSTLYRHDSTKQNIFRPYQRTRRSIDADTPRQKRAVHFRPLFVYKQQQIKKQKLNEQRKRRY